MHAGPDDSSSTADRRQRRADDRDEVADRRELDADTRERLMDARERTLDRWEAALAATASELSMLDDDLEDRLARQASRERDRARRRAEAESRRDDAIERDIERERRERAGTSGEPAPADQSSAAGFARLAADLHAIDRVDEVLDRILDASRDVVSGCDAATILLVTDGRLSPAASTHDWATIVDRYQVDAHCGPVVDAIEQGTIATTDLTADERWTALRSLASAQPARAAFSLQLTVAGEPTGVITFYSSAVDAFDAPAMRVGDVLAAHASIALDRVLERLTHQARSEAWQHALASRDIIGQAKGILMQQHGIGADDAFAQLCEISQRQNRKVRDIAELIVVHRRIPDG